MSLTIYGKFESVALAMETRESLEHDVRDQYYRIAGQAPVYGQYFYVTADDKKRSTAGRIFFNAPEWVVDSLRMLGYPVQEMPADGSKWSRRDMRWSCSSNDLFWKLVRHGYRLGNNQPIPA